MGPVRPLSIKPDPVAVYSGRDGGRLIGILGGPILEIEACVELRWERGRAHGLGSDPPLED